METEIRDEVPIRAFAGTFCAGKLGGSFCAKAAIFFFQAGGTARAAGGERSVKFSANLIEGASSSLSTHQCQKIRQTHDRDITLRAST